MVGSGAGVRRLRADIEISGVPRGIGFSPYVDPTGRRFHAEPVCCRKCGPHLSWRSAESVTHTRDPDALASAVAAIDAGGVVAVKVFGPVCDGILSHDQRIANTADDPVVRVEANGTEHLQRSGRGHPRSTPAKVNEAPVQRHHALVVATAAEHSVPAPFIGVAYDTPGPGADGTRWGGEILLSGYADYLRVGRFAYAPMPAGPAADQPARLAVGYLLGAEDLGGKAIQPALVDFALARFDPALVTEVRGELHTAVRTSSAAMLWEAMAALLGVHVVNAYPGEGSALPAGTVGDDADDVLALPWRLTRRDGLRVYDPAPTLNAALTAVAENVPIGRIAAGFERTLIEVTVAMVDEVALRTGVQAVCLGGTVFTHRRLTSGLLEALKRAGYGVFLGRKVAGDETGEAYGRSAVTAARMVR